MNDDRLIDIETKLAHQEDLVNELNNVITDQQARITRLEELSRSLIDRVRSMSDGESSGNPSDERPPHY